MDSWGPGGGGGRLDSNICTRRLMSNWASRWRAHGESHNKAVHRRAWVPMVSPDTGMGTYGLFRHRDGYLAMVSPDTGMSTLDGLIRHRHGYLRSFVQTQQWPDCTPLTAERFDLESTRAVSDVEELNPLNLNFVNLTCDLPTSQIWTSHVTYRHHKYEPHTWPTDITNMHLIQDLLYFYSHAM